MIIKEKNIYKTSKNKLLKFLLKVLKDNPDDKIVENWEYCKIKLYEVGSIIQENNDSIGRVTDDLNLSRFIIDCNMEEDICEL